MSNCPEHDKLKAVSKNSQEIGEFIDWLVDEDMEICYLDVNDHFYPIGFSTEKLLARFFEIDLAKIEAEKRKMIMSMREAAEELM